MVRLPKNLSNTLTFTSGAVKTGASALEAELYAEQAYSIGLAAKLVETSLARLKSFTGTQTQRVIETQRAADDVHAYFVQRELIGFTNHDHPIEHYKIPKAVLSKVGVKTAPR